MMKLHDYESLAVKAERTWRPFVQGEEFRVENIGGTLYAFTTELGALRLYYKMLTGRVGWSENLGTWYYTKDTNFG